jgi:anhydro-N-acetylmuramic acid kinase
MRILGLISGTSHDGIDACLVDFSLLNGTLKASVIDAESRPYPPELRKRIIASLPPQQTSFEEVCKLDTLIGQEFGDFAADIIRNKGEVDLVSSHGQTVYHWVEDSKALGTLQIGHGAWIASRTGTSVISDLRIQDVAAGGQGAPLVPVLDLLALGGLAGVVCSLNLGGIANITVIKDGQIQTAYDTGPASALIDAVVNKHSLHPKGYDDNGLIAASGQVSQELLASLLADPYYQLPAPKSTGKELFHIDYLEAQVEKLGLVLSPADLVATVTELTAVTVAQAIGSHGTEVLYAAGGGASNRHLMSAIENKLGIQAKSFSELGIEADYKEALAMALIGWLSASGLPATFTQTTGAKIPPVVGQLSPGKNGFPVFQKLSLSPTKLEISRD